MFIRKSILAGVLAVSLTANSAHATQAPDNDNLMGFVIVTMVLVGALYFISNQSAPRLSSRGIAPSGSGHPENPHPEQRDKGRILMEF